MAKARKPKAKAKKPARRRSPRAVSRPIPEIEEAPLAPPRDLLALADAWQQGVLDGSINTGKLARAAVLRHVRDLKRQGSASFPYVFDAEVGLDAARYCELLPHVEGPLTGEPFQLEGWQAWAIIVLFGWLTLSGQPRFRRGVFFMPKGNGKTFLAAALALYVLSTGGKGEKVYSAAASKDQARLSFTTARQMLQRAPQVRDHFGLHVLEHSITQPNTGGLYQPLSAEARTLEGKTPSYVLEDEIHAHPTREVHDNLRSAAAKRPDSRMVIISTAGFDSGGIGYEVYKYARQILESEVNDESQFALLFEADHGMDPWDPKTWEQANPNYGVSVDPTETANEANEARNVTSKRGSFFVKRLGWWASGRSSYFDIDAWDACADPTLIDEQFKKDPCYLGLDLASRHAFACLSRLFVRNLLHRDPERAKALETERHYFLFVDSFINEVASKGNEAFPIWQQESQIIVTPGNVTDYGFIKKYILRYLENFGVREIVSDPYEAAQLMQQVGATKVPFVEYPQRVQFLSPPMKELRAAIVSGRLHHNGNKAMRWMIGNTTASEDANENVFPRKEREDLFIDGVSATLNAVGRVLLSTPKVTNPYASGRGFRFV